MPIKNENPGGQAGISRCCCSEFEVNFTEKSPLNQLPRLSLQARIGIASLRVKLAQTGSDDLTTQSAISACDFLLEGY